MISLMKIHPLLKIFNQSLVDLPSPSNISYIWNFGSLLGVCLIIQILSGLFLAIHYTRAITEAFYRVNHILRDVNYGWLIRVVHRNGARIFFICLYLHVGRGIYYESYNLKEVWIIGVLIIFGVIGSAFLGYVLPWGQISFWGATVITNLFSVIPFLGRDIVVWLWGGFSVDGATLVRFFTFHFITPFLVLILVIFHLLFLHQKGSNNPLGVSRDYIKISFHPYYSVKDLLGILIILIRLIYIRIYYPWVFADPENFIPANPLVTPIHIQPEWYFLFAYAILRSIPNKLGGVIALAMSILVLLFLPLVKNNKIKLLCYNPISKTYYWRIIVSVIILTWIGARPVEGLYIILGQIFTMYYFFYFLFFGFVLKNWENLLN